jgi:hypothetical protein
MLKSVLPVVAVLALLAGCSTSSDSSNSAGQKIPSPRQAALVKVFDAPLPTTGRVSNLSATVCREKKLGPGPKRDEALLLLRSRALMNGYVALHSVTVGRAPASLEKSCDGGIQAKGVGFNP